MTNQTPIPLRDAIIMWLNQVGYSKASYDRLISNVPAAANYDDLRRVVYENPTLFRTMNIKGGFEGLVYLTPGQAAPGQVEEQALSVEDVGGSIPLDTFAPIEQVAPMVSSEPLPAKIGDIVQDPILGTCMVAVVPILVDPIEHVQTLIRKAASENNSSAAENFANAAVLSANALAVLKHTAKMAS